MTVHPTAKGLPTHSITAPTAKLSWHLLLPPPTPPGPHPTPTEPRGSTHPRVEEGTQIPSRSELLPKSEVRGTLEGDGQGAQAGSVAGEAQGNAILPQERPPLRLLLQHQLEDHR